MLYDYCFLHNLLSTYEWQSERNHLENEFLAFKVYRICRTSEIFDGSCRPLEYSIIPSFAFKNVSGGSTNWTQEQLSGISGAILACSFWRKGHDSWGNRMQWL